MSDEASPNFTPRAQRVLALARKEAHRLHWDCVGTEHLLLGLISLGSGVAVNVLLYTGLDLETVRMEVTKVAGTGPDQKKIAAVVPYTPGVKKVMAFAALEAKNLNHLYVGTEHILLGLLREEESAAARVLKNLGVDIERTRQDILVELDPNFALGKEPQARVATSGATGGLLIEAGPFTPKAQKALELAQEEARLLNHHLIDTEHLLLGLVKLGQGVAVTVLVKLGLNLENVRRSVKNAVGTGAIPKTSGNIPYAPRVKAVLLHAAKEAKNLNDAYVGTEHIFLGLLREEDGQVVRILEDLNVDLEKARQWILKAANPNSASGAEPQAGA